MAMPQANGSTDVHSHETSAGVAAHAVKHAAGGHENKAFQPERAVDVSATQQPVQQTEYGVGTGPQVGGLENRLDVLCGPLLNYRHMSGEHTDNPIWHGSVLLVTKPGQHPGDLTVSNAGVVGRGGTLTNALSAANDRSFPGSKLYEDPNKSFWQFSIDVPFLGDESCWFYAIKNMRESHEQPETSKHLQFFVPSKHESMRILFHSCNGFSVGTDEEEWSGPALWNDVLRLHAERPIHIMLGGGDQIYNDSVRVSGPLREWTDIGNPIKRRDFPFNEDIRAKCDEFYFNNYVRWYSTKPFSLANSQIAQVNIWDDHDIIDGFGSYTDHFMRCHVFRGIGGVAHKYYMLFQHHLPPPASTYTTDAPRTVNHGAATTPVDSVQLKNTFVMKLQQEDPSYLIGKKPGPYIEEKSRSLYCQLGKQIALLGIDARTERTRHQVNYPETYDMIFRHAEQRLAASNGAIKHLILLLGIPIAYPRLQWLENIFSSPLMGPLKFLNKRFGFGGGFFNSFDSSVDLLDDLDDHYTAHHHKKERKELILRLQKLSKRFDVRVTILGGDVHLAAQGRFYSKPSLNIPIEQDWRFMSNIISSAITNHPPPPAVANFLARRNKIHHLDHETDETLMEIWNEDPAKDRPGVALKAGAKNFATMPSRNYAIIAESHSRTSGDTNGTNGHANGHLTNGSTPSAENGDTFTAPKNPRQPLHTGEEDAGTSHPAASGTTYSGLGGANGLDIAYRVEIDHHDKEGNTKGYGFTIPGLDAAAGHTQTEKR